MKQKEKGEMLEKNNKGIPGSFSYGWQRTTNKPKYILKSLVPKALMRLVLLHTFSPNYLNLASQWHLILTSLLLLQTTRWWGK